jgi:hypothetical protein
VTSFLATSIPTLKSVPPDFLPSSFSHSAVRFPRPGVIASFESSSRADLSSDTAEVCTPSFKGCSQPNPIALRDFDVVDLCEVPRSDDVCAPENISGDLPINSSCGQFADVVADQSQIVFELEGKAQDSRSDGVNQAKKDRTGDLLPRSVQDISSFEKCSLVQAGQVCRPLNDKTGAARILVGSYRLEQYHGFRKPLMLVASLAVLAGF